MSDRTPVKTVLLPAASEIAVCSIDESPPAPSRAAAMPASEAAASRYATKDSLGVGGMGEVLLCRDRRIGRDVAMKINRPRRQLPGAQARFEREAVIQGQLEHPALVPVYDLGVDESGQTYFTMKRIRGHSLDAIVTRLRAGDAATERQFTRRRLLQAFSQVCLAIAFAHSRGVLHRDIKPANVMLGAFGEVYLLDWGIAKVIGTEDGVRDPDGVDTIDGGAAPNTIHGTILGTPGYMSPEQERGELEALDARADVYALGAVLFELLTLSPLHEARSESLRRGAELRASAWAPEAGIPPELDDVCAKATALDRDERFESARALHDAVERFLEGDRDVERRRELSARHCGIAQSAAARVARSHGAEANEARVCALREASRALALDAENPTALRVLLGVLLAPPADMPPEARAEIDRAALVAHRATAKRGAIVYIAWFLSTPCILLLGIHDWPLAIASAAAIFVAFALSLKVARMTERHSMLPVMVHTAGCVAVAGVSGMFGPLVLAPAMAAANTMFFLVHVSRKYRPLLIASSFLAILVPFALEHAGVVAPSARFDGAVITLLPRSVSFPAPITEHFLLGTSLLLMITVFALVARLADEAAAVDQRMRIHAWYLEQLLPDVAREASVDAAPQREAAT